MGQRLAPAWNCLRRHPVEIVITLLCAAAFVYELRITHASFFYLDDWLFIRQSASTSQWLDAYNSALALSSVVTDRALIELFGFRYTPFRVVGLLCLTAVPLTYFWTTRRQFGAPLAAVLALPLLWYGKYVSLFPAGLNGNLALLAGVVCAAALNRGRRADWVLLVGVAVGLTSAGGGLAIVAACLLHNACERSPLRRWLVVLAPALLWGLWWLLVLGHTKDLGAMAMTPTQMGLLARNLAYAAFESAALGSGPVAVVLIVLFVAYGVWTLSKGLRNAANFLAWSAAVVVWAIGLANTRGLFVDLATFRYRYFALGMVLLAVVPRRPIAWPARFPITTDRRWILAAAGVVLVLGVARGLAVRPELQRDAAFYAKLGQDTRAEALVIGLGPAVTGRQPLGFDYGATSFLFGGLSAAEVRSLFFRYGQPLRSTPALADQRIVDLGGARVRDAGTRDQQCAAMVAPLRYVQHGGSTLLLWSPTRSFDVEVRRLGTRWVPLRSARPRQLLALDLPWLPATQPWQIRALGACRAESPLPRPPGRY